MTMVKVPFGKTELEISIPEENLSGIYDPRPVPGLVDPLAEIKNAVNWPINSKPLNELSRGKKNALIVITDITRPSPDHLMLPVIIGELERGGIKAQDIIILVATGLHRPNTEEELSEKLGQEIVKGIKIVNHVAHDESQLIFFGNTGFGCPVWLNKLVVEADLVISTGIIEPHFFAGFSGGRKSIAIGVAGEETIKFQHQPRVFDHANTKLGNLDGNIFHENAMEIAKMARLVFIVNAVLNTDGEIAGIVAGDFKEAYYAGAKLAREIYEIQIEEQADILIAGVGFPKDMNLYQATRGASAAVFSPLPAVKKGGLIISPALTEEGAGEGIGEKRFYEIMKQANNIDDLVKEIRKRGYSGGGQRAYLLALTLQHADVLITGSKKPQVVRDMHMMALPEIDYAIGYAMERFGKDAKFAVSPHSIYAITTPIMHS